MADSAGPTRSELEALWRRRVWETRSRYLRASARFDRVIREQVEGLTPVPDGYYAVRNAGIVQSAALREYTRVLNILTDLMVHGRMPPPQE